MESELVTKTTECEFYKNKAAENEIELKNVKEELQTSKQENKELSQKI